VCTSLHQLGYREVTDVRIGKFMEVTLGGLSRGEAEKRLGDMCQRLLANTVIEDFRFEFVDE
jgi:phosphoribosylformylglycinamidine synthase